MTRSVLLVGAAIAIAAPAQAGGMHGGLGTANLGNATNTATSSTRAAVGATAVVNANVRARVGVT